MQYSTLNPNLEIVRIHDTLAEIKNVFSQETLDLIDGYFEHDHEWLMDRRLARLSYPTSNDVDPFNAIGLDMCALANEVYNSANLIYRKSKLFLDLPGSEVPKHSDANDIGLMSQVYLRNSNHPIPGTIFLEPFIHTVKYEYNCGYLNLNFDKKIHQSGFLINGYRTSFGVACGLQ